MRLVITFLVLLLVVGCGQPRDHSPHGRTEVGRYQYSPPSGEMPAILLDTASGCIEVIEKFVLDDPSKGVVWIRKMSDEVLEGTPKRCAKAAGKNR